jgi:hypothetical protein
MTDASMKARSAVMNAPAVLGLDHLQIAIPSGGEDAARRFWRDTLGLTEETKPPKLAARGGCWFKAPGLRLHLGVDADFRPAKRAHPALIVRGLPAAIRSATMSRWRATTASMSPTLSATASN